MSTGIETRRLLLGLGALCLAVALTAGTAVLWPALGAGGQAAVLLALTAGLFAGALHLDRLPATAEAVAAVGVAAVAVDAVAGRRLLLADASGDVGRGYWIVVTVAAAGVLYGIARVRPRLAAPSVGAVVAMLGAVVAAVAPHRVADLAVVGTLGAAVMYAAWTVADVLGAHEPAVRATALVGGGAAVVVCGFGALTASYAHDPVLWCGVALAAAGAMWRTTAAPAGGFAGVLLVVGQVVPAYDRPLLVVAVAAPVATRAWRHVAAQWLSGVAVVAGAAATASAQLHATFGRDLPAGAATLVLAAAALVVRLRAWPAAVALLLGAVAEAAGMGGAEAAAAWTAVAAATVLACCLVVETPVAAVAGAVFAVAVDADLALHVVRTPELFALAPAAVLLLLAGVQMWRDSEVPSRVLVPGLVMALLPSTMLAVGGDTQRQVAVLAVATCVLAVGAVIRLGALLEVGAAAMLLVVAAIVGPDVVLLPRWVTLAVVGATLLLGSTWERRMQELRMAAARVGALR